MKIFSSRLSPIPSSSSLSTLRTGLEIIRNTTCWTADGPRRVSLSNHSCSNSFTAASPPDNNGSRLSHQDLLGYTTLRTLRKVRASSLRSDNYGMKNTICGGGSSSGYEDSLIEDTLFGGPSGSLSLGSTPRERVPIIRDALSPCYMGICLPRQLIKIFPEDDLIDAADEQADNESVASAAQYKIKHDDSFCLLCCKLKTTKDLNEGGDGENEEQDKNKIKIEIIKHIERLSNPVWSKQSKQALLHLKQRHASCFQDICLYSDMCSIVSSSTFRLSSRRFLQELFLDLDFNGLLAESNRALKERLFGTKCIDESASLNEAVKQLDEIENVEVQSPTSPTWSVSLTSPPSGSTAFSLKTSKNIMDTLKLTCSENKFPITHQRNQTQSFVPNNYSIYRSSLRDYQSFKTINSLLSIEKLKYVSSPSNTEQNTSQTDDS